MRESRPPFRIGVVSDTHMPRMAKALPPALREGLTGVDLILHAGDFVTPVAIDALEEIAPVLGVTGNNDDRDIQSRFPLAQVLDERGYRIGLVHGHAGRRRTTLERAIETFEGEQLDAIVFGHSHIPYLERRDGMLLLNPGSPTDRRRQPRFSYALLELGETLDGRHLFFERKR